jgi:predicted anti-sigma-YlaC factor YlaD
MAGSALIGRFGHSHHSRLARPWRRPHAVSCEQARDALPGILDGGSPATGAVVEHVEWCLACQAEVARYHRLLRMLRQLRTTEVAVPPGIVGDVLASIEVAANRRAIRSILAGRRLAYAGAVVAGAGAAAALVLVTVWRGRVRTSDESRIAV